MLDLRFKTLASQLQVLDFNAPDLNEKHLLSVAQQYLPKRVLWAEKKRHDLSDIFVLWDVLNIDAVIALENQEGQLIRVGISLVETEETAWNLLYTLKRKCWYGLRQALKLQQYWVFAVKASNFPKTKEEWIDILYSEIDHPINASGCRLIVL